MKKTKKRAETQAGQSLILLLVFVVMAIAITTAAAIIVGINSASATNYTIGFAVKQMAESGAEKALLALLRDPNYSGETFSIDSGIVTATVSGSPVLTIDSTAQYLGFSKRIQVLATYTDSVLEVLSWKETPQ